MTGSNKTTTTTNNQPWSGAQPALSTALSGAQNLYNSGVGSQVYTGNTYTPWSQETQDSMKNLSNLGYDNTNGKGLSGQYQGIINNGGYNAAQQSALKGYQGLAANGGLNQYQQSAIGNTRDLANSSWSVSPELQKIIDQTNADANTNVSLANSAGGRYGSGSGNAAIADAVSKNTNSLLYNDLNNFQSRKDAANSSLFNMAQQGQSNLSGAYGNIANLGQTAFGNLGAAWQGAQAPATTLAQVGAGVEDQRTKALNDQLRIFSEQQNRPWENLSRLNAIASGAGQLGGTTTQSQPGQNPFLTALGYGATGAGLLGSFF